MIGFISEKYLISTYRQEIALIYLHKLSDVNDKRCFKSDGIDPIKSLLAVKRNIRDNKMRVMLVKENANHILNFQ